MNIIAALMMPTLMLGTIFGAAPAQAEVLESGEISESAPAGSGAPEKDLTVEDVKVEGNRLVPTEDILNVVKTRPGDHFDRTQVLEDLKAVNGMGYFDDRNLQVVPEMSNTGGVLLKIHVQENAPVTQFAFQGNKVISTEDISKVFADQLGKPQNLNQLSAAIDKIEQAYHEKGFVLARITDVKDDPDGSISLEINEGTISAIQIVGNKKTKDFIIKNALKLKAGSVYNERQLTADLRRLYGNGYFQDIRRSLQPSPDSPDKYILKVEVDEKRTGSIGLGGGIDTINGPFGSTSFSDANFRGRGQILSFHANVGSGMMNGLTNSLNNAGSSYLPNKPTYQVEANWIEPQLRGSNTSLAVSSYGRNFASMNVDSAMQQTIGTSVTINRPLGNNFSLSASVAGDATRMVNSGALVQGLDPTSYLMNRALQTGMAGTVAGAQQVAQSVRNQQLQGGVYASTTLGLYHDTRDATIDPSKGSYAKLTGTPYIGTGAFGKLGASVSKFMSVGKDKTIALNLQGGTAFGNMPQFAQYRLGGFNGMRGYRMFSDLGSGSSMMMASAEYRFRLPFVPKDGMAGKVNKHVKGVFFFDAGGVNGSSTINNLYQRSQMGAAVGFALRVQMPMVGMIQLNYGLPLISSVMGHMTPRFTVGFGERF